VCAKQKQVVFIDRDGVINKDKIGGYITNWTEFQFIDGVLSALKQLSDAGFDIVIISNQAGVGDGVYSEQQLNQVTQKMMEKITATGVKIQGIYYCLHGKKEGCACRKPKPGLFQQAARDIPFVPNESFFIGDKVTDVEAGNSFGLRNIFVLTGHGKTDQANLDPSKKPETIVPSLTEAVEHVLKQPHGKTA
jgi:D-glycero-D-manno-heptose 1,7-bisphosphate phosphatase